MEVYGVNGAYQVINKAIEDYLENESDISGFILARNSDQHIFEPVQSV